MLTFASERLGCVESSTVIKHPYFGELDLEELNKKKITAPYVPEVKGASDESNFKTDDNDELQDEESEPYLGDQTIFEGF